jgi:SanA protein
VKNFFMILFRILAIAILVGILFIGLFITITHLYSRGKINTIDNAPRKRLAIVFGAGLRRDGSPTPLLKDRVAAASQLYFDNKIEKILMSGDNRFVSYNEPGAMYDYAVSLGVPKEDIILDYAGRRTYDTCYRAREIFKVNDVLLVTQSYHLYRAVFLCNMLGVKADGVSADLRQYLTRSKIIWNSREILATATAFVDIWVRRPVPVLGAPEPIFPPSD